MILNTICGATRAQYKEFTVASDIVYPSHFTISDVQMPGGVVHGFALMKIGNYTFTDKQIIYVYSSDDMRETNKQISYTCGDSGSLETRLTSTDPVWYTGGYIYDDSAHTLTIHQNLVGSLFGAGSYALLIW